MKRHWMLFLTIFVLCGCQIIPGLSPQASATPRPVITITATPSVEPSIQPLPTSTPVRVSTPTALATPSTAPAKPIILVTKDLVENSTKPEYIIKIHYPEISGAASPAMLAFNVEAKKQAQALFAGFQKDFKNAESLPDPNFSSSFAEATYKVSYGEHGILSIITLAGFYYSGAAHPNSTYLVLNFNLIQGKKIELADLFIPGVDYLKAISDYCTADLKKQNRLEFAEGALPKAENYGNWNITLQGLLFTFEPYQVGPYAMGPSEVTIPYAILKPLLKAGNPLTVLVK
jgi:hypothetical protein